LPLHLMRVTSMYLFMYLDSHQIPAQEATSVLCLCPCVCLCLLYLYLHVRRYPYRVRERTFEPRSLPMMCTSS
jgi:hypothetical protein